MCSAMFCPQNVSCCTRVFFFFLKKNSQPTEVLLMSHCCGRHLFSFTNTQMSLWVNKNQLSTTGGINGSEIKHLFLLGELGTTWLLQLMQKCKLVNKKRNKRDILKSKTRQQIMQIPLINNFTQVLTSSQHHKRGRLALVGSVWAFL